ncbi:FadR/GntR family transcriptional regulator [Nocardia asiatica]|uniref:FadR/GntR family transcriptional regulator n=1 Tax=Nocardia asiatica TaxID=209252 RepID=UPI00030CFDDD|nr:FCD domain-containing protein [Nocardia asiatica]
MTLPAFRSRAEEVVGHIERRIEMESLKPGDRLGTRDDLRTETGVAKATVNEAIKLLQDRQRIVVRPGPGGGLFVAAGDPVVRLGRTLLTVRNEAKSVREAIVVREQLEPLIAAEAARLRTPADIEALQALLDTLAAARDDLAAFVRANWDLHVRIAAIGSNEILRSTYIALYEFVNQLALVETQPHDAPYIAERLRVHQDLVAAIIKGDETSATAAAERHQHHTKSP